jgi:hypothetical protein
MKERPKFYGRVGRAVGGPLDGRTLSSRAATKRFYTLDGEVSYRFDKGAGVFRYVPSQGEEELRR